VGGSTTIHTFGAYAGLVTSLILSRMSKPTKKPHTSYNSNIFVCIGTLFLWIYWPSVNFGVSAKTSFAKTQIIVNTIIALAGSCLATFTTTAFLKSKFTMAHILNATISGGVGIGAASGLIINPGGSLLIGFITGVISTLGFQFLTPSL
jgi:ammonium transporter Rh